MTNTKEFNEELQFLIECMRAGGDEPINQTAFDEKFESRFGRERTARLRELLDEVKILTQTIDPADPLYGLSVTNQVGCGYYLARARAHTMVARRNRVEQQLAPHALKPALPAPAADALPIYDLGSFKLQMGRRSDRRNVQLPVILDAKNGQYIAELKWDEAVLLRALAQQPGEVLSASDLSRATDLNVFSVEKAYKALMVSLDKINKSWAEQLGPGYYLSSLIYWRMDPKGPRPSRPTAPKHRRSSVAAAKI